ncbi:hypothetical protein D4R87_00325 [bacterium]|nr:MAG: hypothetical protein D4R87_00325 [bacterium]
MRRKRKVFIAAPLFNELERKRNTEIKKIIEKLNFDVFLAQDNVGLSYNMINKNNKRDVRKKIFQCDVEGLKQCDIVLFLLDGRVPDEGGCVEIGMAYAWGKTCIGYKTDNRSMDGNGDNNIMIDGCIDFETMTTLEELRQRLIKF